MIIATVLPLVERRILVEQDHTGAVWPLVSEHAGLHFASLPFLQEMADGLSLIVGDFIEVHSDDIFVVLRLPNYLGEEDDGEATYLTP